MYDVLHDAIISGELPAGSPLEREAARLGSERITAEGCARMEAEYGFMRVAIAEGRLQDHLRHDEQR